METATKQNETNLSRLRNAFNAGLQLTVVTALRICQTSELRHYVPILKREGMNIKSEWKQNEGKRFKIYWLEV